MTDVAIPTKTPTAPRRRPVRRVLALLCIAATLAAACSSGDDDDGATDVDASPTDSGSDDSGADDSGSDDSGSDDSDPDGDPDDGTSSTSTTAAPLTASFRGVTADTITVGFVDVDFERLRTDLGIDVGSPDTGVIIEALIADLNDRGGINGRMVDVVVEKFLPANVAMADEICLRLVEDVEVFAVLGGFGGPGSDESNSCFTEPGETILVGGRISDERLASATVPWVSADMNTARRGEAFVNALVASGELDTLGTLAVHAVLEDQDEAADVIRDALEEAGATVALRSTGIAADDQIAAVTETELMLERAREQGVDSIVVVGTSATVTDAIFAATDTTVLVPNAEEVANFDHATMGSGDRLLGAGSIASLDDPELAACTALATEAVGADEIPDDANEGDLSFWTSTLRACRNVILFEAIATEAGPELTNDSFAAALATVELPPLPVFPFASLGPDKPDARDTLSILEWDPAIGDLVEIAGPFDTAS